MTEMTEQEEWEPPAQIGGRAWLDQNRDGVEDVAEQPIPGITVHLLDSSGIPVLDDTRSPITTVTSVDGQYVFDVEPNSLYSIRFDPPTFDTGTLTPTPMQVGDDPTSDSDLDPLTLTIVDAASGAPGSSTLTYDAGYATLPTVVVIEE